MHIYIYTVKNWTNVLQWGQNTHLQHTCTKTIFYLFSLKYTLSIKVFLNEIEIYKEENVRLFLKSSNRQI